MKPAPFDYLAPASLDEALDALAEHGTDARPLAGGQSLGPLLNQRLVTPGVIVDLGRIPELSATDGLVLGAMTRQAVAERSPAVAAGAPLLASALRWVGHPAIRNRGTIGGSLAHADPAAELPAVALAGEWRIEARAKGRRRTVAASELFRGPFQTSLEADELIVSIEIPPAAARPRWAWREAARRHRDRPLVGVAASLALDDDGRCASAALALAGAGPTPLRCHEAEALLVGERPEAPVVAAAADAAAGACDPPADLHGSAALRRHLVRGLVQAALEEAAG